MACPSPHPLSLRLSFLRPSLQSAMSVDQTDSRLGRRGESTQGGQEEPGSAASPAAGRPNGFQDGPGPAPEEGRGQRSNPARPQHAEHLNTGPASRAAKGSSSSIPYIDCSDIDSEYDVSKGRVTRSHSQANDSNEDEIGRASCRERV